MNNGFDYPWVKKSPEQPREQSSEETAQQEKERKEAEYKRCFERHEKGLSALEALTEAIDYLEDDSDAIFEVTDRVGLTQKEFNKLKAAHYALYKYVDKLKEQMDDLSKEEKENE